MLKVHHGALSVFGSIVSPDTGPIVLSSDPSVGGPLLLKLCATQAIKVPLTSSMTCRCVIEFIPNEQEKFQAYLYGGDSPVGEASIPDLWVEAAHAISSTVPCAPVVVIAGPKGVGKSTFSRYLVNTLLNTCSSVAYLDSDCGQPECTPPGLVSLLHITTPLFGPPHMHLRRPVSSYFIGETSPANEPDKYLDCLTSLLRHPLLTQNAKLLPLVVNTHGWVKGVGFDVLCQLLHSLPTMTHFVQLALPNASKNLPNGTFWDPSSAPVHMWTLPPGSTVRLPESGAIDNATIPITPVEQRELMWHAWAGQCIGSQVDDVAGALAALQPYEVALEDVQIEILSDEALPSHEVCRALNASIVGLCGPLGRASSTAKRFYRECFGLAIVRSVDTNSRKLLLLTPVKEEELDKVAALQLGRLELPVSLLQNGKLATPYLSMFALSAPGASSRRSRGNLSRSRIEMT